MRIALAALVAIPLSACVATPSGQPGTGDPVGSCHDEGLSQFIGQPASQDLGAQMLRESGARILRWVPKGGIITMEFSADRLTVSLDGSNRVEAGRCG